MVDKISEYMIKSVKFIVSILYNQLSTDKQPKNMTPKKYRLGYTKVEAMFQDV